VRDIMQAQKLKPLSDLHYGGYPQGSHRCEFGDYRLLGLRWWRSNCPIPVDFDLHPYNTRTTVQVCEWWHGLVYAAQLFCMLFIIIVWLQLYNEEIIDLLDTTRDPSLKVRLAILRVCVVYLTTCWYYICSRNCVLYRSPAKMEDQERSNGGKYRTRIWRTKL